MEFDICMFTSCLNMHICLNLLSFNIGIKSIFCWYQELLLVSRVTFILRTFLLVSRAYLFHWHQRSCLFHFLILCMFMHIYIEHSLHIFIVYCYAWVKGELLWRLTLIHTYITPWVLSSSKRGRLLAQRPFTLVLMMINSCSYCY